MTTNENRHRVTSKEGLQQTIKSIELMSQALYSLTEDVLPKSPEWFAVMAEGPVDQIQELLDEINAYMSEIAKPVAEQAEEWEAQERAEIAV